MKKADLLSTLFVGIDVSSRENVVCFLDFQSLKPLASFSVPNLTDFLSTDEIANMPLEKLVDFVCDKGKNRFSDPEKTAVLLQKAARDSYRLDKCLYEPLTIALSSSFNVVKAYTKELKVINSAIEQTIKGLDILPDCFLQISKGEKPTKSTNFIIFLRKWQNSWQSSRP